MEATATAGYSEYASLRLRRDGPHEIKHADELPLRLVECNRCHAIVAADRRDSHEDWHAARDAYEATR